MNACTIRTMALLPSIPPVLVTEPLALDLVNTRLYLDEAWVDVLDDHENRTDWLTSEAKRLGLPAATAAAFTDEAAADLKVVRSHAASAIEASRHGKKPPARALDGLNDVLRASPAVSRILWEGTCVTATSEREGSFSARLAARFAEAVGELLADPSIRRVRLCEAPACVIQFLPRNPSRRWCTPNVCGNRARVARYYQRHKNDQPTSPQPPHRSRATTPGVP